MPNVKALHDAKRSHTVSWAITDGSLREIFHKKERNRDWELPKENGNHEVRVENYWQCSMESLSAESFLALDCPFTSARRGNSHEFISEAADKPKTVFHGGPAHSPLHQALLSKLFSEIMNVEEGSLVPPAPGPQAGKAAASMLRCSRGPELGCWQGLHTRQAGWGPECIPRRASARRQNTDVGLFALKTLRVLTRRNWERGRTPLQSFCSFSEKIRITGESKVFL